MYTVFYPVYLKRRKQSISQQQIIRGITFDYFILIIIKSMVLLINPSSLIPTFFKITASFYKKTQTRSHMPLKNGS